MEPLLSPSGSFERLLDDASKNGPSKTYWVKKIHEYGKQTEDRKELDKNEKNAKEFGVTVISIHCILVSKFQSIILTLKVIDFYEKHNTYFNN